MFWVPTALSFSCTVSYFLICTLFKGLGQFAICRFHRQRIESPAFYVCEIVCWKAIAYRQGVREIFNNVLVSVQGL